MMFKFKSLSHLIEGRKSWSHFCAVQSGSRWLITLFSMTGNEVSPEQHGLENLRNGSNHWVMCYTIIVKAVPAAASGCSSSITFIFRGCVCVCVWTLKLHALHQYWLGLQSFDEGACLLLTWCFACGKHLYMWKCKVRLVHECFAC